jgi:glyoxylase-like metal-dependent hydrolase (beta-lactamase superfamily II)
MAKTPIITLDLNFQNKRQSIASYLIRHADGVVLIECGPGSSIAECVTALAKKGVSAHDVTHILLTHIHLDHAGSAGWWSRQGAEIIVHPVGAPHILNPEKLLASAERIYGDKMETLWGEFLPVDKDKLRVVKDMEEIVIGGLRFVPINTPGHAEHHYAYLFEDICFSGDIGGVRIPGYQYLRVPMPPPELHIERWRESLARLRKEKFDRIAPTHFGIYDDPQWQLQAVEKELEAVVKWVEQMMPNDPPIESLRQSFTEWVAAEGEEMGLSKDAIWAYELANPAGMSADGLQRYWKKVRAAEDLPHTQARTER